MTSTTYTLLRDRCGLSLREAAEFHQVRPDTVNSWSSGRRDAPPGVIDQLRALYTQIERAASEAVKLAKKQKPVEIELGLAADDHEARSLGWPCVGAQAAAFGLIAARVVAAVRIVPRGSTAATGAAMNARDDVLSRRG